MSSVAYSLDESYLYLKHLLQTEFGVVLADAKERHIADRLRSIMSGKGIDSLITLTEKLHNGGSSELRSDVLQAITEHNVNWFGYHEIMSVFSRYILPNINKGRTEPFRVWVVGCGKGQTAFSLAIAADKFMRKEELDLPIDFMATDSAEVTIVDAAQARFTESLLSGLSDKDKKRYLVCEDQQWLVNDTIKSKVKFSTANLLNLDREGMAKVDLIICPDVLVYYTVLVKTQVLEGFAKLLNDSGMLLVGEQEPIQPFCQKFTMVEHEAGVFTENRTNLVDVLM